MLVLLHQVIFIVQPKSMPPDCGVYAFGRMETIFIGCCGYGFICPKCNTRAVFMIKNLTSYHVIFGSSGALLKCVFADSSKRSTPFLHQ